MESFSREKLLGDSIIPNRRAWGDHVVASVDWRDGNTLRLLEPLDTGTESNFNCIQQPETTGLLTPGVAGLKGDQKSPKLVEVWGYRPVSISNA